MSNKPYRQNDEYEKGTFDFYVSVECSLYRSIFYYNEFDSVIAMFPEDESMDLLSRCILVEDLKKLKLWLFRLKRLSCYSCITVDENLEVGQLTKILKFTEKAGYLIRL
jgi:hypothetical protein